MLLNRNAKFPGEPPQLVLGFLGVWSNTRTRIRAHNCWILASLEVGTPRFYPRSTIRTIQVLPEQIVSPRMRLCTSKTRRRAIYSYSLLPPFTQGASLSLAFLYV